MAQGYSQIRGIDFVDVFSPVTRFETFRLLMALTAQHDYELEHVGIKAALLNSTLKEEVYMKPPQLPPELQSEFGAEKWTGKSWRLHRAVFGLKQGSRAWNATLNTFLQTLGFRQSDCDPGLYIHYQGRWPTFILVYVDDMLIISKHMVAIDQIKAKLNKQFTTRDLKQASMFLGMAIIRERGMRKLFISQQNYTETILKRFGMDECKPNAMPMSPEFV